ncbi:queuosine precursor transporter [Halovivax gelatinilyticus]|uniref:queuosine precursor transporter n=1 Tax=Halovivax gelatinilyticus TaxID=2961597 RepID=UPI0020CA5EDA|nr:queuosine precursor transporter [Halovivax gelatinilyticus]
MSDSTATPTIPQVTLIAVFVTGLVTAQLTAAKVLSFSIPFSLPVTGSELVLPGAAVAYAVTFFASDCYTELYGKRAAQIVVNVAFAMNFLVLALVWSTAVAPVAPTSPVGGEEFSDVLLPATYVVAGSLLAYVVSQNWDVWFFHRIREVTGAEKLWLRNIASTGTSQAIDTVIFVSIAFAIAPALAGDDVMALSLIASLVVGQYLLKLSIALLDTPVVYAVVRVVREKTDSPHVGGVAAE